MGSILNANNLGKCGLCYQLVLKDWRIDKSSFVASWYCWRFVKLFRSWGCLLSCVMVELINLNVFVIWKLFSSISRSIRYLSDTLGHVSKLLWNWDSNISCIELVHKINTRMVLSCLAYFLTKKKIVSSKQYRTCSEFVELTHP